VQRWDKQLYIFERVDIRTRSKKVLHRDDLKRESPREVRQKKNAGTWGTLGSP